MASLFIPASKIKLVHKIRFVGPACRHATFSSRYFSSQTPPKVDAPLECPVEPQHDDAPKNLGIVDRLKNQWGMFMELSKHRLTALVVSTTAFGYFMEGGSWSDPVLLYTLVGTSLNAACANITNQVMESNTDKFMKRTAKRPIPSGRMSSSVAYGLAMACGVGGSVLLATMVNPMTAALGMGTTLLYTASYTPLKLQHVSNTWIGALVGAIPPIMGATAVTGDITTSALILGGVLFSWQMPHFMALAFMCRNDYNKAGYKMMAATNPARGALVAIRHSAYLIALGLIPAYLGVTSPLFAVESTAINAYSAFLAYRFYREQSQQSARKMFWFSLAQLPLILGFMLLHRNPDYVDERNKKHKQRVAAQQAASV